MDIRFVISNLLKIPFTWGSKFGEESEIETTGRQDQAD